MDEVFSFAPGVIDTIKKLIADLKSGSITTKNVFDTIWKMTNENVNMMLRIEHLEKEEKNLSKTFSELNIRLPPEKKIILLPEPQMLLIPVQEVQKDETNKLFGELRLAILSDLKRRDDGRSWENNEEKANNYARDFPKGLIQKFKNEFEIKKKEFMINELKIGIEKARNILNVIEPEAVKILLGEEKKEEVKIITEEEPETVQETSEFPKKIRRNIQLPLEKLKILMKHENRHLWSMWEFLKSNRKITRQNLVDIWPKKYGKSFSDRTLDNYLQDLIKIVNFKLETGQPFCHIHVERRGKEKIITWRDWIEEES
jgi:hypothetical protein